MIRFLMMAWNEGWN